MKKLIWLLKKVPVRIVVGISILGIGMLILTVYFVIRPRKGGNQTPASSTTEQSLSSNPGWESHAILVGNVLIDTSAGALISRRWLGGLGDNAPSIAYASLERDLLIVRGNGICCGFGIDGHPFPFLTNGGKQLGFCGFNGKFTEVSWVQEGDLYHGSADWHSGVVGTPQKITSVGYFRSDLFRQNYAWAGDSLLISNLSQALEVDLNHGSVKPGSFDPGRLAKALNPSGKFAAVPLSSRRLSVVDFVKGEAQQFDFKLPFRDFLWISEDRLLIQSGVTDHSVYDHQEGRLIPLRLPKGYIAKVQLPSPDGMSFLILFRSGLSIHDLAKDEDIPVSGWFDQFEWISNTAILASNATADTTKRGVWLVNKSGSVVQLSGQPVDGNGPKPILRCADGAAFISGGDLWLFESQSAELRQVTHGVHLSPALQAPFGPPSVARGKKAE